MLVFIIHTEYVLHTGPLAESFECNLQSDPMRQALSEPRKLNGTGDGCNSNGQS